MLRDRITMKYLYVSIEKSVRQAGEILLSAHLEKEEIFAKEGPANFVTVYDRKIQQFLIGEFRKLLPEAAYYGEEETEGNSHGDIGKGYVFFIDPIDGTTNFLFEYAHSCISVGLSLDGRMIAGFVYDPYNNRMYKGIRGEGAYINDKKAVIENKPLADGIAEFGCARYNDERVDLMMSVVKELFLRSICIRNGGSAAIGISRISTGSNVLYFELMLQPYDYAAGSIILEEAGGQICRADGKRITLDAPCSIVAGTKAAVEEVLHIMGGMK